MREVVPEEIRELAAQPGGDMALGGVDLAATFMRHDLIETRAFGNGVTLLCYQRP